jgi:diaminohydroxyphosphoribosylaminopyrimidine deaminase/5-amino-6-(5-phosphoribosylamino)uracil reductase
MRRAIDLARLHHPHPNPRVGAVVVSPTGKVLGEGSHVGPGGEHAEVLAIEAAGESATGSTLYVTLEPCVHRGRTPPCVDAIISAGVDRVMIGTGDPDQRVAGRGVERLRQAGIEVVEGVLSEDARAVDPAYFHHRMTGMPLVTLKYAMTLDGFVAARDKSSQWITAEEARRDAHQLREEADAVVVGAGTLRSDNPRLDVRLEGFQGRQPRPVVVAGSEQLPADAVIWDREPLIVSSSKIGVPTGDVVEVAGDSQGLPEPHATCVALAELGYLALLLEGGPTLAGAWWRTGVIERGVAYVGGKLAGGAGMPAIEGVFGTIDEASPTKIIRTHSLGSDIRIDFERVQNG